MLISAVRRIIQPLRNTPLHPQWLLARTSSKALLDIKRLTGRVLDIGCADRWVANVVNSACDYIGFDYPATGGLLYHAKPDIFGDASLLPFDQESFDAVIMLEITEHLRYPREALLEAERVLQSGGLLLLSMPFLYPIHDAPYDFQRYTVYGLERELASVGLKLRRVDRMGTAIETAGLLLCLALAGGVVEALKVRSIKLLALPIVVAAIPIINLVVTLAKWFVLDWTAMTQGYWLVAEKPVTGGRFDEVQVQADAHR